MQNAGRILQDPSEIPESDRCIDALGDRRRLQAGRLAAALACVADEGGCDRGADPAATGVLARDDVVDAAVAVVVVRDAGRDRFAREVAGDDVERVRIDAREEAGQ